MPLALEPSGLLAPGEHHATVAEVEATLVNAFPGSGSRRIIYEKWLEHRRAVAELVPLGIQWLDGSFVTAKENPGDADIVTFLDAAAVDALPDHRKIMLSGLFTRAMKQICGCDSFLLVEYPPGDPAHAVFLKGRQYWSDLYSQVRGAPTQNKGFVVVTP